MEVLYMQYESERIEYKSQMIDDIYKEVIAFANTDGGVIYLGIDDKGNLIGIDNVDTAIYTTPSLSLVSTSCEEIAKLTVARLIELVEQGTVSPCDYVIPDITLALRGSIRTISPAES